MPEGDTLFRTARTLTRAIGGQTVTRFETALAKLACVDDDTPIAGRVVEAVEARGKWLLMRFSGDLILLTHMLMSGSWHIYRHGERWQRARSHMRIVLETAGMVAVAFDVPVAEFHTAHSLARRRGFAELGPAPLADEFNAAEAARNLVARGESELGPALLDQRVLAGLGNVFKSEVAFVCGVSPFRAVGTLSQDRVAEIVAASRRLLQANVGEDEHHRRVTTGDGRRDANLWVYGREGEACRKCGTAVRRAKHAVDGRVSFWCPECQE